MGEAGSEQAAVSMCGVPNLKTSIVKQDREDMACWAWMGGVTVFYRVIV